MRYNILDVPFLAADKFDRCVRVTERDWKVRHAATGSARAPVFLQRARGRLLVAVRGTNQHTRVRGHRLERTSKSTVSAVTMMMDNGVMSNHYDGSYADGYMEQEEEWEREGLLDPAWEKQQKKVSFTHLTQC